MDEQFKEIMKFIGKWEWSNRPDGGYTNDPVDPGGETKFGISKRAHPTEDIKNLTYARALEIYKQDYWNKVVEKHFTFQKLAYLMDTAVNMGVARALSWSKLEPEIFMVARKARYFEIIANNPSQVKYVKGWNNRLTDLQANFG